MNTSDGARVCAVVVTYGSRGDYCRKTVLGAVEAGVSEVVVVANAVPDSEVTWVAEASRAGCEIRVVRTPHNYGSAGGYAVGIRAALQSSATWVWLLDDDNLVEPGGLRAQLEVADRGLQGSRAVAGFRSADSALSDMMQGYRRQAPSGSFMHFDLTTRVRDGLLGYRRSAPVQLQSSAYGGLLVSADRLAAVGLPDTSLVLYEDDTEYTHRIVASGVQIFPATEARIHDLAAKWSNAKGARFTRFYSAADETRLYYGVRNRTRFDFRRARESRRATRFFVNLAVFLTTRFLLECRHVRLRSTVAILRGVRDGLVGRSGVDMNYQNIGSNRLTELSGEWDVVRGADGQFEFILAGQE